MMMIIITISSRKKERTHDNKRDDDCKILDRLTGANCGNTAFSRQMLSLWKLYATTVVAKHSAAVAHFCLEN